MSNLATIVNNILADSGIDDISVVIGSGTSGYIPVFTATGRTIGNSVINQSGGNVLIGGNIALHAGNFNSYAPTLGGIGASGTWGISITGNADTVDGYHMNQNLLTSSSPTFAGLTSNGSIFVNGVGVFNTSSDHQISLRSPDAWTGIEFDDSAGGLDYIWFNGLYQTFAIGGGGSSVLGKKLHIDGGTTIGVNYDSTSVPTNGLNVEGPIQQAGNQVLHAGNFNSYAPTLTGGGASGTWAINIAGSSGSSSSVPWTGVSAGIRQNYDLQFRPADNSSSYAGFSFASPGNSQNAGFFLVRGGADDDVYTQNGITLVADLGWLTLAQRTTSNRGVRIMTGTTSVVRAEFTAAGAINFNSALTTTTRTGGLRVTSSGTATTQAAIALQQVTGEGDTIIFADYEPFAEYGIIARNSIDSIDFTAGTTTNSIDSYNITNRTGDARTAYVKARIGLASGVAQISRITNVGLLGSNSGNARNHFTQLNSGTTSPQTGWISAAFGDATNNRVVIGQWSNNTGAIIGSHTPNLDNWAGLTYVAIDHFFYANGDHTSTPSMVLASNHTLTVGRNTINAPQGYVSNGNPWGTGNSAFFPNGISTAGGTNWIYGSNTYIGNAPSNGDGHEFFSSGIGYSTRVYNVGKNSGNDWGLGIYYQNYVSGYGRIRFYQSDSNHSTIHSFSNSWQSGSLQGHSTGAINIAGNTGVTFGGWSNPDVWIDSSGNMQARGSMRAPVFYQAGNTFLKLQFDDIGTSLRIQGGIAQQQILGRPAAWWGSTYATGPVVIRFPGNTSNYGMVHAVVDIYEYNSNNVCTVVIGGHNWAGGWYNYGANIVGYTNKPIRLGVKNGQYCIIIGDSSSVWDYGQVVLRKIQNGAYYAGVMDVAGGYTVSIESDSFDWDSGDIAQMKTRNQYGVQNDWSTATFNGGGINGYTTSGCYCSWSLGTCGFFQSAPGGLYASLSPYGLTVSPFNGECMYYNVFDSNLYIGGNICQNWYSDCKYKENITEIDSALDKIDALRGVEFDWNELGEEEVFKKGHEVGLIAQEVQAVYPQAVREVSKEREDHVVTALVVDYDKFTPLLIQSIKELKAQVDTLKSRMDASGL